VAGLSAILLAFLASCSTTTKMRQSMFGGEIPFSVTVGHEANENSAVAVDLVVVYDQGVLDQLLKLRAAEWFNVKDQFLKDHRDQVFVKGWQWAPSQRVTDQSVPYHSGARKVVLFADYATEGAHREVVDPQQKFHLELDKLDLNVKVIP